MKSRIITLLVAFLAIAGNAVWGQDTSWTGEGTPEDPYQISTPEELKAFRNLVNGGDADACAKLTDNIELDSSEEWEPIMYKNQDASEAGYQGIFDGCGFSISGLYINQAATTSFSLTSFYGLFGIVGYAKIDFGGMGEIINTDAVIKNLTVKGSIDCYAAYISTGGIAGLNIATIQGCTNEVNLKDNHSSSSGSHTMGGICGNNSGSIISCVNKGNVESNTAGGICASNKGSIEKCCNEGTISGSIATGGISGQAAVGGTSSINNCYNEGYLNAKSGVVAGICAVLGNYMSSTTDVTITNCHNYGTITGDASKAGICTVYYREGNTNIEVTVSNNYYLDSTAEVGFLYTTDPGDEMPNDHPGQTEAKSKDAFANGEVSGINPGCVVVMDENYDVIDEIYYIDENGEEIMIDPHGFIWIDDDHYILAAYKQETVEVPDELGADNNLADLAVLYIEEIQDGEVLWEFCSKDYDQFFYESNSVTWAESMDVCYDYMHFNSMNYDTDGNILVSCRHLDAILKISTEDGSLIWQLGGEYDDFGLTDDQLFSYQHSIILTEGGEYMLFDNADAANWAGEADTSSVIRLRVDEENMTVTDFVRYTVLDYFSIYMGAIRELDAENSVYLWSVGGNYSIDSETPPEWSMIEYTEADGNVSYNFSFRFDAGTRRLYCSNKCE